jgi:hypothetical protein
MKTAGYSVIDKKLLRDIVKREISTPGGPCAWPPILTIRVLKDRCR